ncbi:MAG: hypothetical protein IPN13_14630 [Bacteroidetes bacterium]|nr:hypothetical protein [Bacteroidota bacterium]
MQRVKQLLKTGTTYSKLADTYENDIEYYLSLKGTPHYKLIERDMGQALAVMRGVDQVSPQLQAGDAL